MEDNPLIISFLILFISLIFVWCIFLIRNGFKKETKSTSRKYLWKNHIKDSKSESTFQKTVLALISESKELQTIKGEWIVPRDSLNRLCIAAGFQGGLSQARDSITEEAVDDILNYLEKLEHKAAAQNGQKYFYRN